MRLIHKETGKEVPMGATIFIERTTIAKGSDGKETEKKEKVEYKVTKDTVNDLIKDGVLEIDMGKEERDSESRAMMHDILHVITGKIMEAFDDEIEDKGFAFLDTLTRVYPAQALCMILLEIASAIREKEGIKEEAGEWYTLDFVDGETVKVDIEEDNMEIFADYPLFKTPKHLKKAMDCVKQLMKQ